MAKRFTAVIALMEGTDEGKCSRALYHFVHSAYADEEKEVGLGQSNPEGRKLYWDDHIWKGFYASAHSEEVLEDLEIFTSEEKVDPNDILLILGDAVDFILPMNKLEFGKKLEKFIQLGVKVLIITDGFEVIEENGDGNVHKHLISQAILDSYRKDREGRPEAVKRFREFVDANLM